MMIIHSQTAVNQQNHFFRICINYGPRSYDKSNQVLPQSQH